jgi:hypothetical protein
LPELFLQNPLDMTLPLRSLAAPCLLLASCSIDTKHYASDGAAPGTPDASTADGSTSADAASPGGPARIIYVGDAIAHETAAVVRYELTLDGTTDVTSATKDRLALCDFFPDTEDTERTRGTPIPALDALVRTTKPHAVILQFWGNSSNHTPCMRDEDGDVLEPGSLAYYERYRADAIRATELIRDTADDAGGPAPTIFWVLQGPDPELFDRPLHLNENFQAVAAQSSDSHTIDAGHVISKAADYHNPGSRYGWAQWLPCTDHEVTSGHCIPLYGGIVQIHKDDKTPELCLGKVTAGECDKWSAGVFRYGKAIADAVRAQR